jgi:beta-galactosidase GanA
MGPLDMQTEAEWSAFAADLAQARALGLESISIDVWWGQVERDGDQQFDWSWVDRAARTITNAGLSWRPVLAFHACGTNVGDTCSIPIPRWLFARYPDTELRYVSAQGHTSNEVLSVWATPIVLEQYKQFFAAFAERYAHLAPLIVLRRAQKLLAVQDL